ncbi:cold-shock DNA-binding protein family [Pseudomonas duriflava]|uniref:Cold-shock DNA-binding protein family n=1 Tax=Pseudomonas duriflava TaxID=459528 RepID=A0A562QFS3_9PSED|nr:cold shock domain-containing protein [Pseudomonas duriflava]TWI55020.1 cold-shock DNA-binding protein family [Pseudomonas duriflava]
MSDRQSGTVKWFDRAKGYGFIIQTEGPELFVHHSSILGPHVVKQLMTGQSVSYIAAEGKPGKGMQAESVQTFSEVAHLL